MRIVLKDESTKREVGSIAVVDGKAVITGTGHEWITDDLVVVWKRRRVRPKHGDVWLLALSGMFGSMASIQPWLEASPRERIESGMGWDEISGQLPELLERLKSSPPVGGPGRTAAPAAGGVYVLTEDSVPKYVGQTRNAQARIRQHTGAPSQENQASFAFLIAKQSFIGSAPLRDLGLTRKELARIPAFADRFREAKERVARMEIRFVEIGDPALRTVFEVYAAVRLGTSEHNSFETH